MLVKDLDLKVFSQIDENYINQEIFSFVDSELLDLYFNSKYKNYEVTDLCIDLGDELYKVISDKYLSKWNNIVVLYLEQMGQLKEYQEVVKEVENRNDKNVRDVKNTNSVSAYDVDDYVDNTEDKTLENNNLDSEVTKETVYNKIVDSNIFITVNKYLTELNIYNIMIIDLQSEILEILIK